MATARRLRLSLTIGAQKLEYRMIGPRPDAAPTLVLLHEGLGCVGLWGDFPDKLQASDRRRRVRLFARRLRQIEPGHAAAPALATCTTRRARRCRNCSTPSAFKRGLLIGHSDGASIAAIYAGSHQDHRVGGLGADRAAFLHRGCRHRLDRRGATRPTRPAICARGWRAGMPTSTTPSRAGTAPGSIPNSANGTSPNSSPISACRC